jgi:two-component system, chemotaxis family, response regulator Rcp1
MSTGLLREILLVEDNAGDVRLTQEAFTAIDSAINMHVARDGVEAMEFLRREGSYAAAPRPDLILLDLNLPRMTGREVLSRVKRDEDLRSIPVIILSASDSEFDVAETHALQVNCYLTKPVLLEDFERIVRSIDDFWLVKASLPPQRLKP